MQQWRYNIVTEDWTTMPMNLKVHIYSHATGGWKLCLLLLFLPLFVLICPNTTPHWPDNYTRVCACVCVCVHVCVCVCVCACIIQYHVIRTYE